MDNERRIKVGDTVHIKDTDIEDVVIAIHGNNAFLRDNGSKHIRLCEFVAGYDKVVDKAVKTLEDLKESNDKQQINDIKIWDDIEDKEERFNAIYEGMGDAVDYNFTDIEKSAIAALKIHQLIEAGYGGVITEEENLKSGKKYCISPYVNNDFEYEGLKVLCALYLDDKTVSFHTEEQAKEFIKYPPNVQLLRDYYRVEY